MDNRAITLLLMVYMILFCMNVAHGHGLHFDQHSLADVLDEPELTVLTIINKDPNDNCILVNTEELGWIKVFKDGDMYHYQLHYELLPTMEVSDDGTRE